MSSQCMTRTRRFLLPIPFTAAIASAWLGCGVSVPRPDEGPFACNNGGDCTDGYYCDTNARVCVSSNQQQPCTGSSCLGSCSNRGAYCQSSGTYSLCAYVRSTNNTFGLTCVPCPSSCAQSCIESPGDDKPAASAAMCGGTTSTTCTDMGCPCTSSAGCGPTLICSGSTCIDPCQSWPCPTQDQACVADQGTSGSTCTTDCTAPNAVCALASGRTCDATTKVCKSTNNSLLQVLSVHPAAGSKVASNLVVRVSFNMGLSFNTVTDATFYVDSPAGRFSGQRTIEGNSQVVDFVPANGTFDKGQTYQIHVLRGILCNANMPLDHDVVSSFTTF